MPTVTSNCRLCPATCGILVTHDGERITGIQGDREHPVSQGFTCPKGRAIPKWYHAANRLDHPRLHGVRVDWDPLLDDAAGTMRQLIDDRGPESIASYWGTGAVTGFADLVMLDRLFAEIGSNQRYSAGSVDAWPVLRAAELVTGFPDRFPTWSPEQADPSLIVMVGLNPGISMGWVGPVQSNWMHRLKGFRKRGGELWVMDPRRTKAAVQASRHIAPRPGTDVFVFGWLVRELLEQGFDPEELGSACAPADVERLREAVVDFTLPRVLAKTGLPKEHLTELLAAIRRHGKVGVLPGSGVAFGPYGELTAWLVWVVMIVTGSIDTPRGLGVVPPPPGDPNFPSVASPAPAEGTFIQGPASRPDLAGMFGERPAVALADEIEAGNIRSLIVYGGSPVTALPDPERTRAALRQLEMLAVVDVVDNDLTQLATHVIPSTSIMEEASFLYAPAFSDGRAYYTPAVLEPAAERRPAWWLFVQLAQRMGFPIFDGVADARGSADEILRHAAAASCSFSDAVFAAGPHGFEIPKLRPGWFHEQVLPGGRWRVAPQALVDRLKAVWSYQPELPRLIAGRQFASMNSVHFSGFDGGAPQIHLSSDVARDHDVGNGDRICLSTASGAVEGAALVDGALGEGCVWMPHGWDEQNVNRLTDGVHVNRLTGQPVLSAIPVTVERLSPAQPAADVRSLLDAS